MKIRINKEAAAIYVRGCYRHAHPSCGKLHREDYAEMLRAVQGAELEVETEYLFADQFNTVPIPGVSAHGLRVMVNVVDAVIDDLRPGRYFTSWSNKHYVTLAEMTPEEREHAVLWKPVAGNPCAMMRAKTV